MTNHGKLERPKTKAKIIAWLIEGKGPTEIAALVSTPAKPVSRQAICNFRNRHAADIAPVVERIEREITDYAIAQKVNRIAALDDICQRIRQEVEEYGLAVTEVEYDSSGKEERRIETRNFRASLVRELRGVMRDVAEELGQLPQIEKRYGDTNIMAQQVVIVRETPGLGVG